MVKHQLWAVAVLYHKPYFHQDLQPYIYGAMTAMSNIAWSRLKPSCLGLDSPFDAISTARLDFPHLPIARRHPPMAYGMAQCYPMPYCEPLSLTEIWPFCYGCHRYGMVRTPNIYIDSQDTNMILAYSTKPVRPESMAWWWFRDSSQLPSVTAEGKTIDWHVHRADSQGTAWHQFGDWKFTHSESPAITSLRNFESLPCACVDLGWPIVLPSAVTWLSG